MNRFYKTEKYILYFSDQMNSLSKLEVGCQVISSQRGFLAEGEGEAFLVSFLNPQGEEFKLLIPVDCVVDVTQVNFEKESEYDEDREDEDKDDEVEDDEEYDESEEKRGRGPLASILEKINAAAEAEEESSESDSESYILTYCEEDYNED